MTVADFEFVRSDVATAERKVECPVCDQWSVHGPSAEEALFEHWAMAHAAASRTPGGEPSRPVAPPHFLHTQEAVEDELRGAGHGDVADLSDIVFVATSAARRALGVCSICDGTGTYPADTEADGYPGPEGCPPCAGTGWTGGEQS